MGGGGTGGRWGGEAGGEQSGFAESPLAVVKYTEYEQKYMEYEQLKIDLPLPSSLIGTHAPIPK